jgi:hypothetical protein
MARAKAAPKKKAKAKTAENPLEALQGRREDYVKGKVGTGKDAKVTIDCGDDLAEELRECSLEEVYALAAKELGETKKALHDKYDHLNTGMQRMNLGNRIRGARNKAAKEAEAA